MLAYWLAHSCRHPRWHSTPALHERPSPIGSAIRTKWEFWVNPRISGAYNSPRFSSHFVSICRGAAIPCGRAPDAAQCRLRPSGQAWERWCTAGFSHRMRRSFGIRPVESGMPLFCSRG